jgi:hypothetical protein
MIKLLDSPVLINLVKFLYNSMGSSSAKVLESPKMTSSPEFFWLSVTENSILKVNSEAVLTHSIPSFQVNKGAAIGYTDDNNILIIGGEKLNGKTSKKVFYVNVQSKSINRLSSLKQPSKSSTVIIANHKIYLIESSLAQPLQIYSSGEWTVFQGEGLNNSHAACFVHDSTLYCLSSIKPNQKPTKKIFTLNLQNPSKYKILGKQAPFKLEKPVLVKMPNCIIVAGGSIKGSFNYNFFIGELSCDRWKVIEGPNYPIVTSPGLCVGKTAVWVEVPKIVIINRFSCVVWNVLEKDSKEVTERKEKNDQIKEESKFKSFSFKKTETKEKKIIGKKFKLEENILSCEKINEELYMKGDDTVAKEKLLEKYIPNTPNDEENM